MRKNNLAGSVTFLAATVIGFLSSINVTYIKQKVKGNIEFWVGKFMLGRMLLARFPNLAKSGMEG